MVAEGVLAFTVVMPVRARVLMHLCVHAFSLYHHHRVSRDTRREGRERERERECVCVCACVCESQRERERGR